MGKQKQYQRRVRLCQTCGGIPGQHGWHEGKEDATKHPGGAVMMGRTNWFVHTGWLMQRYKACQSRHHSAGLRNPRDSRTCQRDDGRDANECCRASPDCTRRPLYGGYRSLDVYVRVDNLPHKRSSVNRALGEYLYIYVNTTMY